MEQRPPHRLNRWQLPLWLFGAGLPCAAVVISGYYEFAHPDRDAIRDQLLAQSAWAFPAVIALGVAMMCVACVFADDSIFRRFLFVVFSILFVPASLLAGVVLSFIVNGLPVT